MIEEKHKNKLILEFEKFIEKKYNEKDIHGIVFNTKGQVAIINGNDYAKDIIKINEERKLCHAVDEPAYKDFINGIEKWYYRGTLHNMKGPSIKNFNTGEEDYYIFGKKFNNREEWKKEKEKMLEDSAIENLGYFNENINGNK